MASEKEEAIALISSLPDNVSLEDIHYHLYIQEKVKRGEAAIDDGRTLSQEEAEQRIQQWQESSGQNQP